VKLRCSARTRRESSVNCSAGIFVRFAMATSPPSNVELKQPVVAVPRLELNPCRPSTPCAYCKYTLCRAIHPGLSQNQLGPIGTPFVARFVWATILAAAITHQAIERITYLLQSVSRSTLRLVLASTATCSSSFITFFVLGGTRLEIQYVVL